MRSIGRLALVNMGIVYLVWGSTFYAIAVGLHGGIPPLLLIGLRFLAAGAILYAAVRWTRESAATTVEWRRAAILGFFLLVCGPSLVSLAEQVLDSGLAALLLATSPFWVVVLEGKPGPLKLASLALGLSGLTWLLGASIDPTHLPSLLAAVACLLSGLAWAVGSLAARTGIVRDRSSAHQAGTQMLCAGLMLTLGGFLSGEKLWIDQVQTEAWMAQAYLTLFGSLIAFSAYNWAVRHLSATTVATHAYVNPVVAVLLGGWLLGERLAPQALPAAGLILLSVVLLVVAGSQEQETAARRRPVLARRVLRALRAGRLA